ncbi:RCC1 domain-containing protein [Halpernia humi]|nr:hypothetical protein [Halpernia humi]
MGLVMPIVDSAQVTTTPANSTAVEATVVYDSLNQCIRYKSANEWSNCLLDKDQVKNEISVSVIGKEFWLSSPPSPSLSSYYKKPTTSGDYFSLFTYTGNSTYLYGAGNSWATGSNGTVNPANKRYNIKPSYVLAGSGSSFIVADGKLYVSGSNTYRQLGVAGTSCATCDVQGFKEAPMPFSYADEKVLSVANINGSATTALLTDKGNVYTTGYGLYGHNGNGTTANQTAFTKVTSLSNIVALFGNDQNNLVYGMFVAIDKDGKIFAWGRHYYNYIPGFSLTQVVSTPVDITSAFTPFLSSGEKIVKVSISYYQTIALTNTGKVIVAGENYRIGYGTGIVNTLTAVTPFTLNAGEYVVDMEADSGGGIIATNKRIFVAGLNPFGRFGTGDASTKYSWTPVSIPDLDPSWNIEYIDLATNRTFITMAPTLSDGGGRILGSGSNIYGTLGSNNSLYQFKLMKF